MKKHLVSSLLLIALALPCWAQDHQRNLLGPVPRILVTERELLDLQIPAPGDTNPPAFLISSNSPGPVQALLNLLPAWDPTLTNTFKKGDAFIGISPLWKSQTASGSTPYLSTYAGYFFTKNLGGEGELVSLGDGTGKSTVDSISILGLLRKDVGNIAGYLEGGPCRDFHQGKFGGDLGLGFLFEYRTGLQLNVDTRWRYEGKQSDQNGFLTRASVQLNF